MEAKIEEQFAMNFEEAADGKDWVTGKVVRWIGGFGFVRPQAFDGQIFVHQSRVKGSLDGLVGQDVAVQIEKDLPKGPDKYRAVSLRRWADHEAELASERATMVAAVTERAATASRKAAEDAGLARLRTQ